MAETIQLDLFSWDKVTVAFGFDALAAGDFTAARSAFTEVQNQFKDHDSAKQALLTADHWENVLANEECLKEEERPEFFWREIMEYEFGVDYGPVTLKNALLERLAVTISGIDPEMFRNSEVCLGRVYLELKRYDKARESFIPLMDRHPYDVRLMTWHGKVLWHLGERREAKDYYTRALLTSPARVMAEDIEDEDILLLIEDAGIYLAPVYGWLYEEMPLVDIGNVKEESAEHRKSLDIYSIMRDAEKMRIKGDHQEMIAHRERLKANAPDVFQCYMKRVGNMLL